MKYANIRMIHSVEFYGFILCALLFASYYTLRKINDSDKWLNHSNEVLGHSTKLQLLVASSEVSARNFSLTGKPDFLTAFDSTTDAALNELSSLNRLTVDNPELGLILDSVNLYLQERINFHQKVIEVRKSQGELAAFNLIETNGETPYLKKFGYYIGQLDKSEHLILSKRKARSEKATLIANISFMVTAIVLLILIFQMMRRNRREFRERNELLDELLTNSERMKQAEKLAALGVWSVDLKTGLVNSSEEMWRIWGYEPGKTGGTIDNYLEKVHPDDYKFVRKKMMGLNEQQGDDDYTFRLMEDGQIKTVSTGTAVLRNAEHKLVSITGYAQDITEKTTSATDLATANKELVLLFNRIGEVIFSRDVRRNNYIHISDNCFQVYGYTAEEFLDDQDLWLNIIYPEDQKIVSEGSILLSRGENVTKQYRIIKKDGSERWLESSMVPSLNDDRQLVRIDGVSRDITDSKLQALERVKMVVDLMQRNKTLEEFTYIVSHNLRAPVANIIGLGGIFKAMDAEAAEKIVIQEEIVNSINRLDTVISDLNVLLQVRKQVCEKKEMVYFNDVLKELISNLPQVKDYENIDISGEFSLADSCYSIRNYISNIFYNLIVNSIYYRREDVKTCIQISSSQHNGYLELVFKDNGKGIDLHKHQTNMFGLYRRFDNTVVGKGMGLFIVKTEVELLGGTITVESELNTGTTFSVRLPMDNQ